MSIVYFDQEKKFECPCGCGKKLTLSIQQTEGYGWNAYVMDGQKIIAAIGENNLGD
jgi:hypothetical protein